MFVLLLACNNPTLDTSTPDTSDTSTDTDTGTVEGLCAADPSVLDLEDAASIIISNTDVDELNLGVGVASCDLDGDGHEDLLVSGSHGIERRGRIGVFYGPATDWPRDMSLDQADSLIQGSAPYTYLGYSVECGDLDGDGFGDIVAANAMVQSGTIETHYGLHIWYGSSERLPASADEGSAAATLSYDYGAKSTNTLFGMRVEVADLDQDGLAELALAVNPGTFYTDGQDEVIIVEGGRIESGALEDQAWFMKASEESRLNLHAGALSESETLLMTDNRNAGKARFTILKDPMSSEPGGAIAANAWLNLTRTEGDWTGTGVILPTQDGALFVAGQIDDGLGSIAVLDQLQEGRADASDMTQTGGRERSVYDNMRLVPDYNGDGVADLGVRFLKDYKEDQYIILDGSKLTTPGLSHEELLLDTFVLNIAPSTFGTDLGFADLDGDGCSDFFHGDNQSTPGSSNYWGRGRVLIVLSSDRSNEKEN